MSVYTVFYTDACSIPIGTFTDATGERRIKDAPEGLAIQATRGSHPVECLTT